MKNQMTLFASLRRYNEHVLDRYASDCTDTEWASIGLTCLRLGESLCKVNTDDTTFFLWMLSPSVGCTNIANLVYNDAVEKDTHSIT